MKVSYVEGLANHNSLESCVGARKDDGKALIEESAGRILSREMRALPRKQQVLRDADAVGASGRQYRGHRHRKVRQDPARSLTPCMYGNALLGNREIPRPSATERSAGRIGKSKDARR